MYLNGDIHCNLTMKFNSVSINTKMLKLNRTVKFWTIFGITIQIREKNPEYFKDPKIKELLNATFVKF